MRRNDSFYCVRNMFMIAMVLALVGYALYPTAPPRLMPQWGFTDVVQLYTGVTAERGAPAAFLNLYAAVPSMHVCFALMTGSTMVRLSSNLLARVMWAIYTPFVVFVVVATGNHYLTDCVLGMATAGLSALLAAQLLARARPDAWSFGRQRVSGLPEMTSSATGSPPATDPPPERLLCRGRWCRSRVPACAAPAPAVPVSTPPSATAGVGGSSIRS